MRESGAPAKAMAIGNREHGRGRGGRWQARTPRARDRPPLAVATGTCVHAARGSREGGDERTGQWGSAWVVGLFSRVFGLASEAWRWPVGDWVGWVGLGDPPT